MEHVQVILRNGDIINTGLLNYLLRYEESFRFINSITIGGKCKIRNKNITIYFIVIKKNKTFSYFTVFIIITFFFAVKFFILSNVKHLTSWNKLVNLLLWYFSLQLIVIKIFHWPLIPYWIINLYMNIKHS